MKLLLMIAVATLFVSCMPGPRRQKSGKTNCNKVGYCKNVKSKKVQGSADKTPGNPTGISRAEKPDQKQNPPLDINALPLKEGDTPPTRQSPLTDDTTPPAQHVPAEDDIASAAVTQTPVAEENTDQRLISLEENFPAVQASPSVEVEDIIPLDSTEDQILVAQINKKYRDYVELRQIWEKEYAPALEAFLDQTTNPEVLQLVEFMKTHVKNVPFTLSEIQNIEEKLQEDGFFTDQEDRENAQNMSKQLNAFFGVLESALLDLKEKTSSFETKEVKTTGDDLL